jgi:F-box and WD-40 domain protein CDC4
MVGDNSDTSISSTWTPATRDTEPLMSHRNLFRSPLTPAPSPIPHFCSYPAPRHTSCSSSAGDSPSSAIHNLHNHPIEPLQPPWGNDSSYNYDYRQSGHAQMGSPRKDSVESLSAVALFESVKDRFQDLDDDRRIFFVRSLLSMCGRQVLSNIIDYVSPFLKRDPFAVLPNELSLKILSYVDDPKTLARASQVSKLWYLILSDDLTWKELCNTHHFRRLSATVNLSHEKDRAPSVVGLATGSSDLTEAIYNPEPFRRPMPTSYRSHFKHEYLLNTAWASGGRLAAKYVISNPGVVTALIMKGQYIAIALDDSKIFVFREDGKMLRSLFGHVMGVWALTLLGDTLVSGGCDRDVRVWDLKTGNCSQILRGHSSTVRCLQMVDESTAVSGSRDGTVRVWDVKQGVCKRVLEGHDSSVRCVEVVDDICVSGSYDFTAKVWRISTGELLNTLVGHISQIYSLSFDGKRAATGSLDASIRLWDVETGQCLALLQGHTSLVGQLQMKGSILVSGGSDGGIRVWDLNAFTCIQRFTAHDNSVTTLQFDEERIVSGGSDGKVELWELATGKHIRSLSGPFDAVWRVAFKDEKLAILASKERKIHMELMSFTPSVDEVGGGTEILEVVPSTPPSFEFRNESVETPEKPNVSKELGERTSSPTASHSVGGQVITANRSSPPNSGMDMDAMDTS